MAGLLFGWDVRGLGKIGSNNTPNLYSASESRAGEAANQVANRSVDFS